MKKVFEAVIRKGGFDLQEMLKRIDEYHISGSLSAMDRFELIDMARGVAAPKLDAVVEVQRLWRVVRELQATIDALGVLVRKLGGGDGVQDEGSVAVSDWKQPTGAHDAYYTGDAVRYGDMVWVCAAPAGMACVWSPDVMPDYWRVVTEGGESLDS